MSAAKTAEHAMTIGRISSENQVKSLATLSNLSPIKTNSKAMSKKMTIFFLSLRNIAPIAVYTMPKDSLFYTNG